MKIIILSAFFVTLYGSGFVATQIGVPYADPISFLTLRFLVTSFILILACIIFRVRWPNSLKQIAHIAISGILIIGVFSIGVFVSIDMGTPAATSSLIISLQPLLASLVSLILFKTEVSRVQWYGLGLGFVGVSFLVLNKIAPTNALGLLMSVLGLAGLTLGSVYQKRFCSDMNILAGGAIHTLCSGLLCLLLFLFKDETYIHWEPEFIGALLWMSIVVSIGALSTLYILIKHLEISKVSSLFYLIPVSAVLLSIALLEEKLDSSELIGILLTSLAIFLVTSKKLYPPSYRKV